MAKGRWNNLSQAFRKFDIATYSQYHYKGQCFTFQ